MAYGYILIVIYFTVSGYAGSYFVSEIYSPWSERDKICAIAIPPIQHMTTKDIAVDIDTTLIGNGHVWVGYIKELKLFDYKGCFQQNSSKLFRSENVTVGSPGECFDLCSDSSLIGLSVNKCFCLKDTSSLIDAPSNYMQCTTECGDQRGVACGNQTDYGTKYVSVYTDTQIDEQIKRDTDDDAHCLRLDRVKMTFVWTNCSKDLLVFCDFDGTCLPTSSEGINKPWIENANLCFSHGGSPMHSINCSRMEYNINSRSPVWTGFVRSYVISSAGNTPAETDIQYGFLQQQKGKVVLKFTKDGSEKNRILCSNDKIQPPEENKGLTLLVVIVIIVVAVLVTVVAVIVSVVIWRRRKRLKGHDNHNAIDRADPVISSITNANVAYYVDDKTNQSRVNQDDEANKRIESKHGQIFNVGVKHESTSQEPACRREDNNHSVYDSIEYVTSKSSLGPEDDNTSPDDHTVYNYSTIDKQLQQIGQSKYDIPRFSRKPAAEESDVNIDRVAFEYELTYKNVF